MFSTQKALAVLVLLLALGGVGYVGYKDFYKKSVAPETKTTTTGGIGVTTGTNDDVTVKPLPIFTPNPSVPKPSLERAISFANSSMPPEAQAIMRTKITEAIIAIKADPNSFEAWNNLALYRKAIGDHEGARLVWEYLNTMSPDNFISFVNLGDLYHFYLKNYSKSEANFLQAIKNGPVEMNTYLGLHELYKLSYRKETTRAADILKQGLAKAPKSIDLMITLASYYKEKGDTSNARTYYEQALVEAKVKGNTTLIATLEEEIKNL